MKIFLSHAQKDRELAWQLGARLERGGFTVWDAENEITPGDNYGKKIGKALENSDLMVFLLTPSALASDLIQRDIEFALGSRQFENRVFTVLVGSTLKAGPDVPWILLKLPHCQIESAKDFGDAVKEIRDMAAHYATDGSNA